MAARGWAFGWLIWPLLALLGGQGISHVIFIFGLLSAWPLMRQRIGFSADFWLLLAFLVWVSITTFWSPQQTDFFELDFATGSLSIEFAPLRISIIILSAATALALLMRLPNEAKVKLIRSALIGISIILSVLLVGLFTLDQITTLVAPQSGPQEVGQNINRAVNLTTLALPVLIGLVWIIGNWRTKALAALSIPIVIAAALVSDSLASIIAIMGALSVALVALLLKRHIFLLLGTGTAALLLAMPLLIHAVNGMAPDNLPPSIFSRVESNKYVVAQIFDNWLIGSGMDAVKTWRDTFGPGMGIFDGYRIVPGHPHNIGLHLWAETGLIGTALLSAAIFMTGFRLSRLDVSAPLAAAISAFWVISLVFGLVSYSLWNDAVWAAIAFMSSGLFIMWSREKRDA